MIRFVAKVVEALAHPPRTDVRQPGTWITRSPDWLEYFGLALSVHHTATHEPLVLTSFETAFRNTCESVGWSSDPPASPTRRFIDLIVQPGTGPARRLSLKSTAARNFSESTAHISKLTEAAWIQDQRKAQDRRRKILGIFRDYAEAVDSIVLLRAFRLGTSIPFRYQFLEIPASILPQFKNLRWQTFSGTHRFSHIDPAKQLSPRSRLTDRMRRLPLGAFGLMPVSFTRNGTMGKNQLQVPLALRTEG